MEIISVFSFLSAILTAAYVVGVISFVRGWARLIFYQANKNVPITKVSVLVAARNESQHIAHTITDLLAQDYDKNLTEIIIIDDHSTDETANIIASFAGQGVKLISLNENKAINSYKKKAIQTAIAQCNGSLIVTTDADCRMGKKWLSTLVNFYEANNYQMISSPVAYFEEKNLFESIQSLEFLYLIGLGASTIGNKKPSTCNGANLAYSKTAFYQVGGFKGIDDIASGDDELLLHKIAANYNGKVGFLKNTDAIVYTHAKANLKEFIQQRKRWASKSTKYKNKTMLFIVFTIWIFNLSILLNLVVGFWDINFLKLAGYQIAAKFCAEFLFLFSITNFVKRKQLLVLLPILTTMHTFYMVYIGLAGNFGKYSWKDRMVN